MCPGKLGHSEETRRRAEVHVRRHMHAGKALHNPEADRELVRLTRTSALQHWREHDVARLSTVVAPRKLALPQRFLLVR